jgi:phosphate transport system substrate-binding protein
VERRGDRQAQPKATLPSTTIIPFHRADSSGTTDNFTKYLTAAAPATWTFPGGKDFPATLGGQSAKGSDGVAAALKSTPGSIGYLEYSFTQDGGVGVASIDTGGGGAAVKLTTDTASAAVAAASIVGTGGDLTLKLDYATKVTGAYPIILVTYEITCATGLSGSDLDLTKNFLTYTSSDAAQALLPALGYAPLPKAIQTQVQAAVAALA